MAIAVSLANRLASDPEEYRRIVKELDAPWQIEPAKEGGYLLLGRTVAYRAGRNREGMLRVERLETRRAPRSSALQVWAPVTLNPSPQDLVETTALLVRCDAPGADGVGQILSFETRLQEARVAWLATLESRVDVRELERTGPKVVRCRVGRASALQLAKGQCYSLELAARESRGCALALEGTIGEVTDDSADFLVTGDDYPRDLPAHGGVLVHRPGADGLEQAVRREARATREAKGNVVIRSLLGDPSSARPPAPVSITPVQRLDDSQRECAELALGTTELSVVYGPPGTGKTTFVVETLVQYLERNPGHRVLLVSQTHQGVDNAIERLLRLRPATHLIRVGGDDTRFSDESRRYWAKNADALPWQKLPEARQARYEALLQARDVEGAGDTCEMREHALKWQQYKAAEDVKDAEAKVELVAGTLAGAYIGAKHLAPFHLVVVDEAAKATVAESLLGMVLGERWVLVGDPKQLSPYVDPGFLDYLRRGCAPGVTETDATASMLSRLASPSEGFGLPTHSQRQLSTQYRMLGPIGDLVSEVFYDGTLRHGRTDHQSPAVRDWTSGLPLTWVDSGGSREIARSNERQRGTRNPGEAQMVFELLAQLEMFASRHEERVDVSVITGYRAQVRVLRERLDFGQVPHLAVSIDTIDAYQGRDAQVVLFSLVRTNRPGFMADDHRVNVAMSRARDALVVVGDLSFAAGGNRRVHEASPLHRIATWVRERGGVPMSGVGLR